MVLRKRIVPHLLLVVLLVGIAASSTSAQSAPAQPPPAKTKIILDTDIGDDIDDAFALALALRSPEVEILGITTAWGDTALRARLVDRFLQETHVRPVPVLVGAATNSTTNFSQADWAEQGQPSPQHPEAVEFLLAQAAKFPGEITVVAIGPLSNLGEAIDKDPATFRKLNRIVLMGGSIRRGYGDLGYGIDRGPQPEYNIYSDVAAAQKLFASGVPIFMMPLDSTQLLLDENKRTMLFATGSPLANALAALYFQWVRANRNPTATLFDVMAMAYVVQPDLCPVQPFHITIDEKGMTRPSNGPPNASACLTSDSEKFFHFLLPRLTQTHPRAAASDMFTPRSASRP